MVSGIGTANFMLPIEHTGFAKISFYNPVSVMNKLITFSYDCRIWINGLFRACFLVVIRFICFAETQTKPLADFCFSSFLFQFFAGNFFGSGIACCNVICIQFFYIKIRSAVEIPAVCDCPPCRCESISLCRARMPLLRMYSMPY